MKLSVKASAGLLALAGVVGVLAAANSATANDQVTPPAVSQEEIPAEFAPSSSGGAVDLKGNAVESKIVVTDEMPSDLGELQYSGKAFAGESGTSGSFN